MTNKRQEHYKISFYKTITPSFNSSPKKYRYSPTYPRAVEIANEEITKFNNLKSYYIRRVDKPVPDRFLGEVKFEI